MVKKKVKERKSAKVREKKARKKTYPVGDSVAVIQLITTVTSMVTQSLSDCAAGLHAIADAIHSHSDFKGAVPFEVKDASLPVLDYKFEVTEQ